MNRLNKKFMGISGLLLVAALALAACSSPAAGVTPSAAVPNTGSTTVATVAATSMPTTAATTMATTAATSMPTTASTSSGTPAATSAAAANNMHDVAQVNLGQVGSLGDVLVDSNGMTLYAFKKDTANTSNCNAACQVNWPPLLTKQAPTAGAGVDASKLGTIPYSADSSYQQVTYNGMPLYYFHKDAQAGDFFGQGLLNLWYVVNPAGDFVTPAASSSSALPTATTSGY